MVHQQKPVARNAAGFFFGAFQRGLDGGEKLREQFCLLTDVNIPPMPCKQTKQPCVAVCRGGVQNAEPPMVHQQKPVARNAAGFFFGAFQRGLDGGEKLREQFCLLTDVNIPPLPCKQMKKVAEFLPRHFQVISSFFQFWVHLQNFT